MKERKFDLISMGRAAVDLFSEQIGACLEEASTLAKYVGGCPANIAIGCARLGLNVSMLSRVGDEAMGRFVRNTLKREGVDVGHLATDSKRLTGLVILGVVPPDHFPLIFYRENCSDMAMEKGDIDPDYIASAKALLVSGTHCSQEHAFAVTKHAVAIAGDVGTKVILDIDYRPVLWGATGHDNGEERYIAHRLVAERLREIIPYCDLIVGTEEEVRVSVDAGDLDQAVKALSETSEATFVLKKGSLGCLAFSKMNSEPIEGAPFRVKVLNVLGAGDAFMSGFLRGYLRERPLEECCALANANGALVVSRHGCSPAMPYWEELNHFMNHPRDLAAAEHLHHCLSVRDKVDSLCLLAFDHRKHFENLSMKYSVGDVQIIRFKQLVYTALKKVRTEHRDTAIGLIVDGQYGEDILVDALREEFFTVRCIESPNAFPLDLIEGGEAAAILRSWPKDQRVKVLCYVTSCEDNDTQIPKLRELYKATKLTGHRLLVELVDREKRDHLGRVKAMIAKCYAAGIYPSWWKLQPVDDPESWKEIESLVGENDPYIHGILLLGEERPLEEMGPSLRRIAGHCNKVKGFAIGRSIWGDVAEKWFEKTISDEMAIVEVEKKFVCFIKEWKQRRIADDSSVRER